MLAWRGLRCVDGDGKFSSDGSQVWFLQSAVGRHILLAGLGPQCIEFTVQWTCFRKGLEMKLRRMLLATVALVIFAGAVIPAQAAGHPHHRRHPHHRHHR